MNINEFKSNFEVGVRPSLYKVQMTGLPQKLEFLAKTAQLPGRTIGQIEVPFLGKKVKVAGDDTYEDLALTIMLDNDFAVRNEIEAWMERIKSSPGSDGAAKLSDYYAESSIIQLDTQGDEIAEYNFVDIWPNNVGAVDLGFETVDTIAEYTVNFSYNYWLRVK